MCPPVSTSSVRSDQRRSKIAIVGLGGRFPGGRTLGDFWANVAAGVDAGRIVPEGRWRLEPRFAVSSAASGTNGDVSPPDHALSSWGCYLEEAAWQLPNGRGLRGLTADQWSRLDPLFRLGLNAAWDAVEKLGASNMVRTADPTTGGDAHFTNWYDPARCGVILGSIALPVESVNDLCWDVLGNRYIERVLHASGHTFPAKERQAHRWSTANRHALGLPAALIARELGWSGPAFTLDAACASSIYAIKLAMDELRAGRVDVMLAGGLSRPDCQYTQIGFSQLKALSQGQKCRPLDARADGLVVGEGAGMFLLMRLEDALAGGHEIHGLLVEAGLSNDRGGSLLSPRTEGQLRAMREAYTRAGWSPESVDLIECHATGTPVGDQVEIASLHELWQGAAPRYGKSVLGAVKSNVGHLLTGAGAAALMKVLFALKHQTLPCTANFQQPAVLLQERHSPFKVLSESQPWEAPRSGLPRRAAVNGFGFGGINGHLLVEEFVPEFARRDLERQTADTRSQVSVLSKVVPEASESDSIAIIGFSASLGGVSLLELIERWQSRHPERGSPLEEDPQISWPIQRFRIPPVEQQDMLPQQGLMLDVASEAKAHAGLTGPLGDRCGLFVGIALDIASSNFHLRWRLEQELRDATAESSGERPRPSEDLRVVPPPDDIHNSHALRKASGTCHTPLEEEQLTALLDGLHPPLTPNRVMGNLGGIVASRVARELDCGGPSFVLSSEEVSGLESIRLAAEALRTRQVDLAIAGAVDLPDADQTGLFAETLPSGTLPAHMTYGAGAVVLKRLADAERDGDTVWAVVEQVASGVSQHLPAAVQATFPSLTTELGHAGAASGMVDVVAAVACLAARQLPPGARDAMGHTTRGWQFWLRNRSDGPRRSTLTQQSLTQLWSALTLAESPISSPALESLGLHHCEELPLLIWPQVIPSEGLSPTRPASLAERAASLIAAWENSAVNGTSGHHVGPHRWRHFLEVYATPDTPTQPLAVLMVSSNETLAERLGQLTKEDGLSQLVEAGLLFASSGDSSKAAPPRLAFVFPGSGSHFLGMGRELALAFPAILEQQDRENQRLADQFRPDLLWNGESSSAIGDDHRAMIFGQVALATLVCDLLAKFGVTPQASIGNSLGESAALFGLRIWTSRDDMLARMLASRLFAGELTPPYDVAREAWRVPADEAVPWASGIIERSAEELWTRIARLPRVELLIVLGPKRCLVGGDAEQIEQLRNEMAISWTPLSAPSTVHVGMVQQVEPAWRALHELPVTPRPGVSLYSTATASAYQPSTATCAEAITAQALHTIDFPAVIAAARREGVNTFLEIGPGSSCTRLIGEIVGSPKDSSPARSASPLTAHPVRHFVRTLAWLAARGIPVDFTPLFAPSPIELVTHGKGPIRDSKPGPRIEIPIRRLNWKQLPVVGSEVAALLTAVLSRDAASSGSGAGQPLPPEGEGGRRPDEGGLSEESGNAVTHTSRIKEECEDLHPNPLPGGEGIVDANTHIARPSATPMTTESISQLDPAEAAYLAFEERLARLQEGGELEVVPQGAAPVPEHAPSPQPDILRHPGIAASEPVAPPRSLSREQCLEFAIGKIGEALGPLFAEVDQYPTRVRLPDEPLMLVDRITHIEGEPLSMTSGRLVTEHDVTADRWYLDGGRIPTAIAVESGQADLFLSGWLGIDFHTKGLAVYRLLDAIVTFHRGLPMPGETIVYDIRILKFFQQGETWLFKFEFDGTVNGEPLLTMREGCAGFFTPAALAAGKGIIHSTLDKQPRPGVVPADWREPVAITSESFSDAQIEQLRQGDLVGAFGEAFQGLPLARPYTIPGGKLRLVDRVLEMEPGGGKYGLGRIKAALDIHPDDWFLECHFCDDHVMPGTLMYECCLHTLRIYLLRMGWIGEADEVVCEPITGVQSRLKCRGQVLETTKQVWYEVTIRELGYEPEAYCLADALMFADGKPIVEITNMSLRMTGLTKERVESLWAGKSGKAGEAEKRGSQREEEGGEGEKEDLQEDRAEKYEDPHPSPLPGGEGTVARQLPSDYDVRPAVYGLERITAYAIGKPSEAFGPEYAVFDQERKIARLPGPPFQFLDRIVEVGGPPFVMKAGCHCVAQYDVPVDTWYFAANRQAEMPFSVLLETALQPCGWLAAYAGSALTSETDIKFRNLGGKATQHRPVTPGIGTLTTTARMTQASMSGGMIIQHFSMEMHAREELVYSGTTYFGFFSAASLANQVGLRDAKRVTPEAISVPVPYALTAPFPDQNYSFVDEITSCLAGAGTVPGRPELAGFVRGVARVDPGAWYYKAHFFEDPVMPGSLGLEAFLQVIKHWMASQWNTTTSELTTFETPVCGTPHAWVYRGQVIPRDSLVTVEAEILSADPTTRTVVANGWLEVDGRVIYQMQGWTVRGS
ncbi:MAG: type I polyketide synthase [Planctomyces sp.]|nr:type I polyketide synthase [Planctomyces sp.]